MLNWFKILSFLSLLFFAFACKQADQRTCFKSLGKTITKTLVLGDFTLLRLHPYISYELVKDSMNYVEISCGENLFPFIDAQVEDSTLSIYNNNKCRFLRGYDKNVKATIHINLLSNLYFDGTEELTCRDTILANYCTVMMRDAGGNVSLKLKSKELSVYKINASGLLTLTGKAWKARFENTSFNKFDATNLILRDSIYFLNQGYGNMYINTDVIDVFGRVEGEGNVYYKGLPALTNILESNIGKFIELN
jgi:hypothetical protein